MSWIRTAVSKAVEVGNKNNITRTVKNYADSVVQQAGQAVAGGAKILQDRIGARNQKSFKHAVKRLEEAAISCRGPERVQLLRRWLILLKEIEKLSGDSAENTVQTLEEHLGSDEMKDNTKKSSLVLFYDSDDQSEPMNFRDVFLHSQALEGITLSMGLKEALAQIRICSTLEGLLLKKKMLHNGDTPEIHAQKVDKLQVLSESLANSSAKAEKRILDTRSQREEALKFRESKENEVGEIEKEIGVEIAGLEKQRDELEAELKKVNISLAAACKRLQIAREERDQFDQANNQILEHLKNKEEELSKSVGSCKAEADVIKTWMNFLEDTWALQCTFTDAKDRQAKDELERHENLFVNLAINLISAYQKELEPSIGRIRQYVDNLKALNAGSETASQGDSEDSRMSNPRRNLEEEYQDYEAKIVTTFSVVDNMKEHMYSQQGRIPRKEDSMVKELFDNIEKLRMEFESIERPTLEIESPDREPEIPTSERPQEVLPTSSVGSVGDVKMEKGENAEPSPQKAAQVLNHEAELAKLESEFGKLGEDYASEEIGGWEFDELEKELASSGPEKGK